MWDVITHPNPNFKSDLTEPEWRSNYVPLFYIDVVINPCRNPDAG